jgi:DNA-binding NtrC family response regulator
VEHFLRLANREFRRSWTGVSAEAARLLGAYAWPGNVRELRAVVQRAALLHDERELRPDHLPAELRSPASSPALLQAQSSASSTDAIATLATVELEHIRRVLEQCHGNRTLAAQHLGITRQTLSKKIDSSGEEG